MPAVYAVIAEIHSRLLLNRAHSLKPNHNCRIYMTHLSLNFITPQDQPGEFDDVMNNLFHARNNPERFNSITTYLVNMVSMHEVYPQSLGLDPDVDDGLLVRQVSFPQHEFTPEQNQVIITAFEGYGIIVR